MGESFDNDWEIIHSTQEWGRYPSEPVIRFVARNYYKVPDRKSIKILDFGCGAGAHTWYLAREGFDAYGFDGSRSAIERTKKRMEYDNLEAYLEVKDALNIEYENDFFDAIIDSVCVCCNTYDDIKRMYSEVYRMLKENGKMFSSSFTTKTTGYGFGEKIENDTYRNITAGVLEGRGTQHFWTIELLKATLEEIGFRNIIIEYLEYIDRGNMVSMYNTVATK